VTITLDLEALGLPAAHGLDGLVRAVEAKTLMEHAGTCAHPFRLTGSREVIDAATGELLDRESDRRITVSCGNRRARVCGYCSTLYKYDAYNLVVAGMRGGKDVPTEVGSHPRLFVTVTAPSFGPVHRGPHKKTGNLQPCTPRRDGSGCFRHHRADDPLIGTPLDPSTYDYQGHVLFNALAGKLWSETLTEIRRALAKHLRLSRRTADKHVKVKFAKVAEYQARGVVHFHAVARLDGPDGPGSPPPAWATADLLEAAIRDAVARTTLQAPDSAALGAVWIGWGEQIDIRAITSANFDDSADLTDIKVARYIAKYATKSAESSGVELPPMACRACAGSGRILHHAPDLPDVLVPCRSCSGAGRTLDLDQWKLTDHARRLIDTCWSLGAVPELAPLKLRKWAHMLGFGGHFATKSRSYSTTFGALRQERADFTARRDPLTLALGDSPDLIVINHWSFAGRDDSRTAVHPHQFTFGGSTP
jgi:hypothetical protein